MKLPVKYSTLVWKERKEVLDEYIKIQNEKCWYCNSDLNKDPPQGILDKPIDLSLYPDGFSTYKIHLQHDHDTDWTEGAVHWRCNCILFEYEGR